MHLLTLGGGVAHKPLREPRSVLEEERTRRWVGGTVRGLEKSKKQEPGDLEYILLSSHLAKAHLELSIICSLGSSVSQKLKFS